ncbi:kinase-like domain-containing protein [Xylariaceae sp. FL0804]|nr:kinase-like domain-containing protein [Xylariaceae sp. FL0804]
MACPTEAEERALVQQVLSNLAGTPFSCSALTRLSGGTANFLYCGHLVQPHPAQIAGAHATAENAVIVKVSTDFVAINRDFPLAVSRCLFEKSMLQALAGFPKTISTPGGPVIVRVPLLYSFDEDTHTQVLQYFPGTTDLTTILQSPSLRETTLPASSPTSIGCAIGAWLRMFHWWASDGAQSARLAQVSHNPGMRKLKCLITYDSFIEILERHPETIDGHADKLRKVQTAMRHEFEREAAAGPDASHGLIHGDLWGGNILLPDGPWRESSSPEGATSLFIVDWENIQYGHRAIDVGGMLADLYERNHFQGVEASIPAMRGFIRGYGKLSEDLAYRVAVHAGVHLICWYYRRDRNAPLPFPLPRVLAALTLGRDLVLRGWAKDKSWLQTSMIGEMFADENLE